MVYAPAIHHFMIDLWRFTSCVLLLLLLLSLFRCSIIRYYDGIVVSCMVSLCRCFDVWLFESMVVSLFRDIVISLVGG